MISFIGGPGAPVGRAGGPILSALGFVVIAAVAAASIGYLLRPRWPQAPAAAAAPPLPIIVGGVVFNVPPAAVRVPLQRRPGTQERLDLAYEWPRLAPPATPSRSSPASTASREGTGGARPLLFIVIERSENALSGAERLKSIYRRYIDEPPRPDGAGLLVAPFRDGSPYHGEDVIYDPSSPDRFLVRCSRATNELIWAMCLYGRQVGGAALTFRFPRAWLADWSGVEAAADRLIESWRRGYTTAGIP